ILGRVFILREEYDKAVGYLTEALNIAVELGDLRRTARLKNDLTRLNIYRGNLDEAQRLIAEVREECQNKNLRIPYGMAQFYQAYILYTRSDFGSAQVVLESEALPIFSKYKHRKGSAMAGRLLACIRHRLGQETRALEDMSEIIAIFKEE